MEKSDPSGDPDGNGGTKSRELQCYLGLGYSYIGEILREGYRS